MEVTVTVTITSCGTAGAEVTFDASDGRTYSFNVPTAERDLRRLGFPEGSLPDVLDSVECSRTPFGLVPGDFMKRMRAHQFRRELERLRVRDRLTYAEALSVLRTLLVVEPIMSL